MNRILLVALIVATCLTACKKDGVYNPDKKIKAIYTTGSDGVEYKSNEFEWDGKKLTKIKNFDQTGKVVGLYENTFKNNRLTQMTQQLGGNIYDIDISLTLIYKYNYKGKHLKSIEVYYGDAVEAGYNIPYMTGEYVFKNNKIKSITYTVNEAFLALSEGKDGSRAKACQYCVAEFQNMFLPAMPAKNGSKERYIDQLKGITYEYTYSGKNISQAKTTYTYTYEDRTGDDYSSSTVTGTGITSETTTASYQYDNKENPFQYCLSMYEASPICFNKNNIIRAEYEGSVVEYSYTYDRDGWLLSTTATQSNGTTASSRYEYQ